MNYGRSATDYTNYANQLQFDGECAEPGAPIKPGVLGERRSTQGFNWPVVLPRIGSSTQYG